MENSNPIEQMKGFAEKKLRVLRETQMRAEPRHIWLKCVKVLEKYQVQIRNFGDFI